jgi:hypothetical protein
MTAEAFAPPAVRARPTLTRVIIAASLGNALEWFDFLVYGYFAVTIAKVFFPSGNETTSLLLTLGTFSVSFLVRPIGAIVIGAYTVTTKGRTSEMLGLTRPPVGCALPPNSLGEGNVHVRYRNALYADDRGGMADAGRSCRVLPPR